MTGRIGAPMPLTLDPAGLAAPLSPDEPSGPDLDEAGDLDFLNGIAHAEGLMPAAYFTRDEEGRPLPFDRSSIEFAKETKALLKLLDRTRDLRILALLGRLAMLDRDLAGFAGVVASVAGLLESQWDLVHPRGEGGGFELRGAILHSLEDVPTVILPLQHVELAQSRRFGSVTFRSVMTADGEVPAREGEPVPDRTAIERAIEEAEPEAVAARREAIDRLIAGVDAIAALTLDRAGYESVVNLERLGGLARRIRDFLAGATGPATGEEAPAGDAPAPREDGPGRGAPARPTGRLATVAEASAALAAAGAFLRAHEPSSPAELLVRQAQMLVGKSFLEVMRILVPAHASDATIAIGANRGLRLTFDQLSAVPEDEAGSGDEADGADAASPAHFHAATRAEAMALIREAGGFFRGHEPSSPIPLLLEKAAGMAERDFLAILRDVLPDLNSA